MKSVMFMFDKLLYSLKLHLKILLVVFFFPSCHVKWQFEHDDRPISSSRGGGACLFIQFRS